MYILGLNVFHGDASACIFKDGKLICAAEEERFTRIKHSAGFPKHAIEFCLTDSNVRLENVDYIAINRNPKLRIFKKIIYAIKNQFRIKNFFNRLKNYRKINSLELEFSKNFNIDPSKLKKKIINIDHHLAHAASSVFPSGFDNTNYITIDGFGDFLSTTIGFYDGKKFNKINEVQFPHSLGLFYTAITQYLGFKNYGDEYKVMGLAPYGKPTFFDQMQDIVSFNSNKLFNLNLKYFVHHDKGLEMSWLDGKPTISDVYSEKLKSLLGPERSHKDEISQIHKNIAASTQKIFESILFDILNLLYENNKNNNLCISGGCGMNSVANGKIVENTKFKNVYVNHSPGDSGGAIGAGIFVQKKYNKINIQSVDNPYLGNSYTNENVKNLLEEKKYIFEKENISFEKFNSEENLLSFVANELTKKKIIGFFQGRMEFGPRALGNRSIIADPREKNIRDILNLKIKRRESFRPFAPSILKEHSSDWFETDDDVPFMSKVYLVKEDKKKLIPAVVHVDGSGRLQTVTKNHNNRYHKLISKFYDITSIPLILNTSFNENEPIVCSPLNALDCFLRTKMDYLVLEDFIIKR